MAFGVDFGRAVGRICDVAGSVRRVVSVADDRTGSLAMFVQGKSGWAILAVLLAASLPPGASAVSVKVAHKCNALVAKQFPPRQIGNPAAGSSKGTPQAQRAYFKRCIENGGNMDNSAAKSSK